MGFRHIRRAAGFVASCLLGASGAVAQDIPLGPISNFGKVVVTAKQSATSGLQFEQAFGGDFDSEPAHEYTEFSELRKLGRAVGRLDVAFDRDRVGHCTAFLISERHVMTNAHCLIAGQIQAIQFVTGYVENGVADGTRTYSVKTDPLEISMPEKLDYAILEVLGTPGIDWGTLPLAAFDFSADKHSGMPLIVIGHPIFEIAPIPIPQAQYISRKECRATKDNPITGQRLRHTCDTLVGNSGSPVFSDDTRTVVALHHAGSPREGINYAVPMTLIAKASPIVASLLPKQVAPKPVVAVPNLCDGRLGTAQTSDSCADWTSYIQTCEAHPMHKFMQAHAATVCQSVDNGPDGPAVKAIDPIATDPIDDFPVLQVKQDGSGDYRTIAAAVAVAKPGSRIKIFPGTYTGGVDVDKPLELVGVGDRDAIIWNAKDDSVIYWTAQSGRIANLSLRQTGGRFYGVDFDGGSARLENADLTSQGLSVIALRNGADPVIRNNVIRDGKVGGVIVFSNGKGTLEDNQIFGNAFSGIEIKTGGDTVIRNNVIRDGKAGGVFVHSNGKGTLEDNQVFGNTLAGIEIKSGGDPVIRNNIIRDGKQVGVFVHLNGKGMFEDNQIFSNTLAGIEIREGGDPVIRNNIIRDGKQNGVYVHSNGKGTLMDNQIFGNANSGILIQTEGHPSIKNNRIFKNEGFGVLVRNKGKATLTGNDLRDNSFSSVHLTIDAGKVIRSKNLTD